MCVCVEVVNTNKNAHRRPRERVLSSVSGGMAVGRHCTVFHVRKGQRADRLACRRAL